MCVNDLVAVDSAAAMIEPAISSCKSNALTVSDHCAAVTHRLINLRFMSVVVISQNFAKFQWIVLALVSNFLITIT